VKYRTSAAFDRDFARLPTEHRHLFLAALREHFLPAIDSGTFTGTPPWPPRLRIHRLTPSSVYSLTWNFASPDGRATFYLEHDDDANTVPILVWRRIGDHSIYHRP
jgi:hypothetical protein